MLKLGDPEGQAVTPFPISAPIMLEASFCA